MTTMARTKPIHDEAIQIRIRGLDYTLTFQKLKALVDQIIGFGGWVVWSADSGEADVEYAGIFSATDILALGQDERKRFLFSVNMRALRKEQ